MGTQQTPVWVVIGPNGSHVYSSALGPVCHHYRHSAVADACRFARWDHEDCDFMDDPTWDEAKKAGYRVRRAFVVVPPPTVRKKRGNK